MNPAKITVRQLIVSQSHKLKIGTKELAALVGYPVPSVVSMIKAGSMKLPLDKVPAMAAALQVDPIYLARLVDSESGGRVLPVLEAILRRSAITENECWLLEHLRDLSGGVDLDLRRHPDQLGVIFAAWQKACEIELGGLEGGGVQEGAAD